MTKKIFHSIFMVATAILLACLVLVMGVLNDYFNSVQKNQLKTEVILAAEAVETEGMSYLEKVNTNSCRLTWIAADGTVLFDSEREAADMDSHAEREEIKAAFENGMGESTRYSATLTEKTIYCAKLLKNGTVLRVSVSYLTVPVLVMGMIQPILVIFVLTLIISLVLANRLSKRIVEPLNSLDLNKPLENNAYDELSPLLTHIEQQHRQIRRQKEELKQKQKEFYTVIKNMNEGLVLLSENGMILSINQAAATVFSVDAASCIGNDFLTVERSHEVDKAIQDAFREGHSEIELAKLGKEYQLNMSRVRVEGEISGLVILVFDITDRVFAERNRREFTANVSHELKTPLQSIMGSAELIENGLVKPEDMPRFVGNIRQETARLVTLVEDIIRLSQLDETTELPIEKVDVYHVAEEEMALLSQLAESKHVVMSLEGASVVMSGVNRLLHEVIHNLCENAIKYNVDGGSVTVRITESAESVCLSVADTGIGISAEHQSRVFERFYRVDKSHSKETGGTGLGLSIVKHAVQYMNGKISLESTPGAGTKITICFLKK